MYEMSTSEYALVLTNPVDFSIVKKSLLAGTELFIYNTLLGGIEVTIKPSIGIVEYPKDVLKYDEKNYR